MKSFITRKNSASQSGVFNSRVLLAFALCSAGVLLAMLSFAAPTPSAAKQADTKGSFLASSQPPSPLEGDVRTRPAAGAIGPGAQAPVPSAAPNPNCLPDSVCPDWTARYDGAGFYDRAVGTVTSPDGTRVYVTGISTGTSNGLDVATVTYDATNGAQLWVTRYDSPAHGDDQPFYLETGTQIAISADGSTVFVTGLSARVNGNYPNDYVTIAYRTSDGVQPWASRYRRRMTVWHICWPGLGDGMNRWRI